MIKNFFLLNSTGDVLIEKHFIGHTKRYICDLFWEEVSKQNDQRDLCPITVTPNYYILHVRRNGMFFITATDQEQPPLLILEFLHRVVDVLLHYLQGSESKTSTLSIKSSKKKLNEQSVRENFTLVYHLLDEMVDGGFPSTTDFNQLIELVTPGGMTEYSKKIFNVNHSTFKNVLPASICSKISWRRANVKYVSNEIKVDIVERVDAIISSNDRLVSSEVNGKIEVNCRLSGTPDLTLKFQNTHILSNTVKMHKCVRIKRFQKESVISFVPPDGVFTLLEFSVPSNTSVPLTVRPKMTLDGPTGKVKISLSCRNRNIKQFENVLLTIPFPRETSSFSLTASSGKVIPDELSKVVTWSIAKLPRDKTAELEGTVTLPADYKHNVHPDIKVDFLIKQFSISGLKVETMAIHEVSYKPFKGVRSKTLSGSYYIRS